MQPGGLGRRRPLGHTGRHEAIAVGSGFGFGRPSGAGRSSAIGSPPLTSLLRRLGLVVALLGATAARADDPRPSPTLDGQVLPLLKARCVKCHGPAKREGGLSLATPKGLARGGKHGALVAPGRPDDSPVWTRVVDDEMPPDEPLPDDEKALLRRWIEGGAVGLPEVVAGEPEAADHWAFAPLRRPEPPGVRDPGPTRGPIDRFLQARLEARGLSLGPEADRATLLRRVSLDLTGLPPTPEELAAFLADGTPVAYERAVERLLASPRYGERWGKYWLDAAGYADSNGYFAADSERPLAHRYRDYVVRAWNRDTPLDEALRDQLAGDERSGWRPGRPASPEAVDRLVATHFLRNAPDGTGESDGNPDELRADRYAVLEGTLEILGSSLFGLTLQCARCHDHKFEPVAQREYYQLQAILYPAFPVDRWAKPNERVADAPLPDDLARWQAEARRVDLELAALRGEHRAWVEAHRERGVVRFRDDFDEPPGRLAPRWGPTAPGDDAPAGHVAVNVDSESAPGAMIRDGTLRIIEAGGEGNRWLSTARAFDWTPDEVGGWVQVTFDLVDRRASADGKAAERVGYYLALHDYDDNSPTAGGNVLIDGDPAGGAHVYVDYPGQDSRQAGPLGKAGYEAGRRYGVRVTNDGGGRFRLEHVVDWLPEGKAVVLTAADLPDGGFGFELCCGRSFIVDRVVVEEGGGPSASAESAKAAERVRAKRKEFEKAVKAVEARRGERPGRVAWVSDLSPNPPEVHLLKRGNYADPGPAVAPGVLAALSDPDNPFEVRPPADGPATTGRRLAFANWITRPGSRASALLARVTANRIWQHHFGTGLVPTPENLGYSGTPPTTPALLEYLAQALVEGGWSAKALHRLIVTSAAYRQSSAPIDAAMAVDPDDVLLWRYPMRRLDAEAVRDAMLAASGELDDRQGGAPVPARRAATGEVAVDESADGARRRSVYLQQRRTSVVGMLEVFDAPSLVTNCTRRNATTIALQSLSLLNSDFVVRRARALAARIGREAGADPRARIARAFVLALGRPPTAEEAGAAARFVEAQRGRYPGQGPGDADARAWADLCQMILASNAFLYLE